MTPADAATEIANLETSLVALEAQRAVLGDTVVDSAQRAMRERLAVLMAGQEQLLRQVSLLFLDLVGSTALVGRVGPEAAHAVLDGTLAACTAIVQAHGGRVLQYAGDNLLAAFGAPEVREDDAPRAVRCGLALLAEGRARGRALAASHGHTGFDFRVGVHTGPVLLGGGVDAEGTVRGLAVHVAARMEQTAPPGTLRVSLDTWRLVQDRFEADEQPPLAVKGVEAPMRTWLVRRERMPATLAPRRALDGAAAALVGREAVAAELDEAAAAARHALQARLLLAEAGLGKSRLLAEALAGWADPADGANPPEALVAASQPGDEGRPFALWRTLLWARLGVLDSDPAAQVRAKLEAALAEAAGPARAAEQAALLGQLLGLDCADSPFVAAIVQDGRQLRTRGLHALGGLLAAWASRRPLVLALDDLHWADDDSLDALAPLRAVLAARPVLLLLAARPALLERRPAWGEDTTLPRLVLAPLEGTAREALARALLVRLPEPPPHLVALLTAQADGNPFYMEALVQMLHDRGVLVDDGPAWRLADAALAELAVPPTLVGVLQARLDALPPAERATLPPAAVQGPVFWDGPLPEGTRSALPRLEARGLVRPQSDSAFEGTAEFAFVHHLLHQVTLETVLQRDRRPLHAAVARWLAARAGGRMAEFASRIAEHFEQAGEAAEAASHWTLAAQAAADRHADAAAAAHAARALALDDGRDPRRRFALRRIQSGVAMRAGDAATHEATIADMEAAAEALDDDALRLVACQARMVRLCLSGRFAEAAALGRDRLAHTEAADPAEAAKCRNVLGIALLRQGLFDEARAEAATAAALAQTAGDAITEASAWNNLGAMYVETRQPLAAQVPLQRAQALYEAAGSRFGALLTGINLALIDERIGALADAERRCRANVRAAQEIGARSHEAIGRTNLSLLLMERGALSEAEAEADAGWRQCERDADHLNLVTARVALAQIHERQGRWAEALDHAEAGAALASAQVKDDEALLMRVLAAALRWRLGRADEARAAFAALPAPGEALWRQAYDAAYEAMRLARTLGDADRGHALLGQAHAGLRAAAEGLADRTRYLRATLRTRAIVDDARAAGLAD